MSGINNKILLLLDQFALLLNEITEGRKILNEFDKDRLEDWKKRKSSDVKFGDQWPDDFEDEWE